MALLEDRTAVFIVRVWCERGDGESSPTPLISEWRGSVEHIQSGQRAFFRHLDAVCEFMVSGGFGILGIAPGATGTAMNFIGLALQAILTAAQPDFDAEYASFESAMQAIRNRYKALAGAVLQGLIHDKLGPPFTIDFPLNVDVQAYIDAHSAHALRGWQNELIYLGMVSTVAVNAQNESNVRADLFGEVKLNFVSETLPLERLADAAKVSLVQRHSPALRAPTSAAAPTAAAPAVPAERGTCCRTSTKSRTSRSSVRT